MPAIAHRPTVAVVTPYCREKPDVLAQCLESVRTQTRRCRHILVADGDDRRLPARDGCMRIALPSRHRDNGNTARAIGSVLAVAQGVDAIAYLDADNWFRRDHIEQMIDLHRSSGADVCTATRSIHHLDGSEMYVDRTESDGAEHVDTSCLFLTRAAFPVVTIWHLMPKAMGPLCDRVVWQHIRGRGYATAHSSEPTVCFRTKYKVHYQAAGRTPPRGTVTNAQTTDKAYRWWTSLAGKERERWQRLLA